MLCKAENFPSTSPYGSNSATSSGTASEVAHSQPRARAPDLVGSILPSPYQFRARIQSYQALAAPFPGDSARERIDLATGEHLRDDLRRRRTVSPRPRPRSSAAAGSEFADPRSCGAAHARFRLRVIPALGGFLKARPWRVLYGRRAMKSSSTERYLSEKKNYIDSVIRKSRQWVGDPFLRCP
jgi:hypothetical protein